MDNSMHSPQQSPSDSPEPLSDAGAFDPSQGMTSENTSTKTAQPEAIQFKTARPKILEDTGLDELFLAELISKHLYTSGVLTLRQLVDKLAVCGGIVEQILYFLRKEALVEVLGHQGEDQGLRYSLTDKGRHFALDALSQRGYVGPAPITLSHYRDLVAAQSVHLAEVTQQRITDCFTDVIVRQNILDQLGPAMISGRAIFIYGPAGTGKTYLSQRLCRLFNDSCLIPYAIYVNDQVVQIFDPLIHHPIETADSDKVNSWVFDQGHDARLIRCRRPVVITGGELTLDMLDIYFDTATREFRAPLQLKANNGMFIIDDMGRQHASPKQIFNRWIVPLEDKFDYLSLGAGRHFQTPFDQVLVFSSNINPLDLADDAFLRRIGYKIHFAHINADEYTAIWHQVCDEKGVNFDAQLADFVINDLHKKHQTALCPCHPRDLLGIATDRLRYLNQSDHLTPELLAWAWDTYFVHLDIVDE